MKRPIRRGDCMTLSQFTAFAMVAKHLNVRRASEELRVSQPAISQHLKQMEAYYGVKLYRRLSKGVEMTEAGQSLLHQITPILEQLAILRDTFKLPLTKAVNGALSVGGTFSASAILLPKLLAY